MTKRIILLILVALAIGMGQTQAQVSNQPPPAIITFSTDMDSISVPEAEAMSTVAAFEWQVIQLTAPYHLELQTYQFNEWQTIDYDVPLHAQDRRELAIPHPLNFGPPMVRLAVIETVPDRLVEERIIIIPYTQTTGDPQIELFSTGTVVADTDSVRSIDSVSAPANDARMPVVWEVSNRGPMTNLVFEQVYSDGRVVNAEQPRPNHWVMSAGTGTVLVNATAADTQVQLRLRVIDVRDNRTLAEATYPLDVLYVGSPTLYATTPAPGPIFSTPTPPPPQPSSVQLIYFNAEPPIRTAGETVTLSWQVRNATRVRIVQHNWAGAPLNEYWATNLPATGSHSFVVPVPETYHPQHSTLSFELVATDLNGREVRISSGQGGWVTLNLACPFDYFFATTMTACPTTAPQSKQAAFQPFENGDMLWLEPYHIFVLDNDGTYDYYQDEWQPGTPIPDVDQTPPPDRVMPERGFGYVWATHDDLRARLGWGLGIESGYTAQYQEDSSIGKPGLPDRYISLPDGSAIVIDMQGWRDRYHEQGVWRPAN